MSVQRVSSTLIQIFFFFGISATLFSFEEPLYAFSLKSPSDLNPQNTVIDFDKLPAGLLVNPYKVSGVTISSKTALVIGSPPPIAATLFPKLTQGNILASFNQFSEFSPITLNFNQPISEIGLTWIDPNLIGNFLQAFNSSGQLIEQVASPLGPTGGIFASFVGIQRPTNDIAKVVIKNAAPSDYYAIDRISFGSIPDPAPAPVPEPTSVFSLLAFGTFAVSSLLKRKRQQKVLDSIGS